jgi:hypothetical protein
MRPLQTTLLAWLIGGLLLIACVIWAIGVQ